MFIYRARKAVCTSISLISAFSLSACSIYPLPQDVTGSETKDIVQNIRCEARKGLRDTVLYWLRTPSYRDKPIWRNFDGRLLAEYLELQPAKWREIKIKDLHAGVRKSFEFYENSQIAYEFSLQMQESNTDNLDLTLGHTFLSKRRDTFGISASATRKRDVTRIFNIVDTFAELALKVKDEYCERPTNYNVIYPIAGKMPVGDLIKTYIETNEFHNLGGPGGGEGKAIKDIFGTDSTPAIPQMGDTIMFTTKINSIINPIFNLNQAMPGLSLASAGFKADDYRQDTHQVIIVVSTSPEASKIDRLDATVAPPLYAGKEDFASRSRLIRLPPSEDGKLSDARAYYAIGTLQAQRQRSVDDAIIQIGSSLSRLAP